MTELKLHSLFELGKDTTEYKCINDVNLQVETFKGRQYILMNGQLLSELSEQAFKDISHLFRTSHLMKLNRILKDPEASANDRYVAYAQIKNAVISAEMILPSCQDTGTAIVYAKKGEQILTQTDDASFISKGIAQAYSKNNLRYSQLAPLSMYEEKNTGTNLPAQIDIYATPGDEYHFLFVAKGAGSANKTLLFQETKALLNPKSMESFFKTSLLKLGTSACPPYHLAIVIGGTSAEENLKTVKLASCGYLDHLPTTGNSLGRAFRDIELEGQMEKWARETKIGAQFGGKYFAHDARVIRLSRHAGSCPVSIAVSCSADRNIKGKITREGVFLEKLESNPAQFLPANFKDPTVESISIDLNLPMQSIREKLSKLKVATRIMLNGPLIVARDIAHAKLKESLEQGKSLPDYLKKHPIYYAGPAKKPDGYPSGSFGPTTSQRMDTYVPLLQSQGASLVMIGKGNRSIEVTESCKKYGGFYLGSIGGPAALLAKECITKVEAIEFLELGMEAIWKIEVKDFPAFIITDDKGNDFFKGLIK